MIMMDFMYGITGKSCVKSNSDSLNKSVDKSFYDSRGFFAVFNSPTICIEDILQCGFVLRKANLDLVHNT